MLSEPFWALGALLPKKGRRHDPTGHRAARGIGIGIAPCARRRPLGATSKAALQRGQEPSQRTARTPAGQRLLLIGRRLPSPATIWPVASR